MWHRTSYLKNWANWGLLWIPLQEEDLFNARRRGFNRNRCVCVCTDCLQTQFWHNKVCYSDMKSPRHVKDEAQRCSVGKSETLGHTQEPFPPGFNMSCGEESGTSVRQISVVLYRTRLSSAPSASPAFIWRTSIAGSWKCQSAPALRKRTAHCHQFT